MNTVVEMTPEPRRSRAVATTPSPMDIVQIAAKSGNVEMYREAVALMKELDAFAARKAFNNALADARAQLPIIRKNRNVSYGEGKNKTSYDHEDLAEVVDTVTPILGEHGLSHRWRLRGKPGEPVTVTCVISHREGHSEENELSAGADTSGGKNPIQGVKSAVSYLERITLMASLGLASRSDDDDGRGIAQAAEPETYTPPAGSITPEQAEQIRDLLLSLDVKKTAFLAWIKQKRIEDVPAEHFDSCIEKINQVGASRK